jgi:hypothetical protein
MKKLFVALIVALSTAGCVVTLGDVFPDESGPQVGAGGSDQ